MTQIIVIFLLMFFFLLISSLANFFPPKKQNDLYGYRTAKTLSSTEKWEKGNKLFGNLFFKFCLANSLVVVLLFLLLGATPFVILYTALSYALSIVLAIIITNKKI